VSNYRYFEDKHGFIKYFANKDVEFDIVLKGLESLKGSSKWGQRAKDLEKQFVQAFDGIITKLPTDLANTDSLYDFYHDGLIGSEHFKQCDWHAFKEIHDSCIRLFKEVSVAFDILTKDDRRDIIGK
jgi:hypothetical protein